MTSVLVVDDEPFYRQAIKKLVDWASLDLEDPDEAINGEDALRKVRERHYDLLITDIKMPKIDGLELIERAQKISPSTCFIVLSAYDQFQLVKRGFKLGIIDYILKDQISQEEMNRVIKHYRQHSKKADSTNKDMFRRSFIINIVKGLVPEKDIPRVLHIPSDNEGGRIYPAVAQLHPREGDREALPSISQLHDIEEGLRENCLNLCTELTGESLNFFLVSPNPLSWQDLDNRWGGVKQRWEAALLPFDCSISLGFSHNFSSFGLLHLLYREASDALDWYLSRGKGSLLSPPRLGERQSQSIQLPSSHELSRRLIEGNSTEAADALRALCLEKQQYRSIPPRALSDYLSRIQAHLFTASELLEQDTKRTVQEILDEFEQNIGWDMDDYNAGILKLEKIYRSMKDLSNPLVAKAVTYISRNYTREINLSLTADALGVNPSYLSRIFTKEMGIGFASYLSEYRIKKALRLLEDERIRIADAGDAVGISQPETFCRVFKRVMGYSPQNYFYRKGKKLTE